MKAAFRPELVYMLVVLTVACASCARAGVRGVTRGFDVLFETRETAGHNAVDVSRFTLTTNFGWRLNRRSSLRMVLPWSTVSVKQDAYGHDLTMDGFKDVQLSWRLDVRPPAQYKPGAFYFASVNLPTGKEKLNADEQTTIDAINEAAEGFVNPVFGRGLGLKLGYGLSFKQGAKGRLDVKAGFAYRGPFDPSAGITRDDADNFFLYLESTRQVTPRRRIDFGLTSLFYLDETVKNGLTGEKRSARRDANFILSWGMDSQINPGLATSLFFGYTYRGRMDYINAGGESAFDPDYFDVDLGDRINLEFEWRRRINPRVWLNYGVSYMKTMASEDDEGHEILDTERDDLGAVIGMTRAVNSGLSFNGRIQFGLTDTARDLVAGGGLQWDF